jgi:hypothetical protein
MKKVILILSVFVISLGLGIQSANAQQEKEKRPLESHENMIPQDLSESLNLTDEQLKQFIQIIHHAKASANSDKAHKNSTKKSNSNEMALKKGKAMDEILLKMENILSNNQMAILKEYLQRKSKKY